MSIDVFGRKLIKTTNNHSGVGIRGPRGDGFQISVDGQYDINHKRLINVGEPVDSNDAVSVRITRSIVREETKILSQIIESLRIAVDNTDLIIHGVESEFQTLHKNYKIDLDSVQDLSIQNVESIQKIDSKLSIVERTCEDLRNSLQNLDQFFNILNERQSIQNNQLLERLANVEENLKINTADIIENIKSVSKLKTQLQTLNNGK